MKIVPPNIWMLLLRIALLLLFIYLYQFPLEKIRSGEYQENLLVFSLGLIMVSIFPAYLLWTLFGVLWVRFLEDESKVCFHYFYKSVETSSYDIDGYFRTHHNTKLKNYNGLLIKLKTGKVIEVSEYNLKSISDIVTYLKAHKIPLRGSKSSWFPIKRRV